LYSKTFQLHITPVVQRNVSSSIFIIILLNGWKI